MSGAETVSEASIFEAKACVRERHYVRMEEEDAKHDLILARTADKAGEKERHKRAREALQNDLEADLALATAGSLKASDFPARTKLRTENPSTAAVVTATQSQALADAQRAAAASPNDQQLNANFALLFQKMEAMSTRMETLETGSKKDAPAPTELQVIHKNTEFTASTITEAAYKTFQANQLPTPSIVGANPFADPHDPRFVCDVATWMGNHYWVTYFVSYLTMMAHIVMGSGFADMRAQVCRDIELIMETAFVVNKNSSTERLSNRLISFFNLLYRFHNDKAFKTPPPNAVRFEDLHFYQRCPDNIKAAIKKR